jgi:hypothetical protein
VTPTNRCLDGETLAAWVDGGLSRNDAAMAEAHVSSCPRCQEIAGLIVKTTPVAVVDVPWWRRRAAWLVPVTAGVAAAGLLMIAPTNPAPSPAPAPAAATLEPAGNAATPAAPPTAPRVAPPAETKAKETTPAETRKERPRDQRANTKVAAAPAAAPSAATAPPAAAAGRLAGEQPVRQSSAVASKQAVSPDGALRWRITERGALERSTDGGTTWQAVNVGVTATFTTIQAPEPRTALVRTTDGRAFRTSDGGATWHPVPK